MAAAFRVVTRWTDAFTVLRLVFQAALVDAFCVAIVLHLLPFLSTQYALAVSRGSNAGTYGRLSVARDAPVHDREDARPLLHLHLLRAMSNFRDSTVVIIETGRTHIRAGQGLHDLLRLPTIVRALKTM